MSLLQAVSITVIATFFYHLLQSSIPQNTNPVVSMVGTYTVALAITILFLIFGLIPTESLLEDFKSLNWRSLCLGTSVVGIEFGFLMSYRSQWSLSLGPTFTDAFATIFLVGVELFFLRKTLSASRLIGLFFCILGLVFLQEDLPSFFSRQ